MPAAHTLGPAASTVSAAGRAECVEAPPDLDFSLLATRTQLAAAFGATTGLHPCWFSNLADTPVLLRARKWVEYSPGRGVKEFWFCPLEVMHWLVHSKRKRGRPLDEDLGWALLKQYFPRVYRH